MAKTIGKSSPKKGSKVVAKKVAKKTVTKKVSQVLKSATFQYWGLVTMNKKEAYIHVAFESAITQLGLIKWSDGYLASLLQAKAMVLNASIVKDWQIEKIGFAREDPEWREQDFPFWVGKNEADQIYNEIIKLNSKL